MLNNTKYNSIQTNQHPFHIVDPSPWPFLVAFSLFGILFTTVCYLHELSINTFTFIGCIIIFLFSAVQWFTDITIEGTYQGHHTLAVQQGLRYGMVLFIVSEIMFFFAFFWAFFYSSMSPSVALGCIWPPLGIEALNPFGLPLLNTIILLSSGVSVTWAHRAVAYAVDESNLEESSISDSNATNYRKEAIIALVITIILGALFTCLQLFEYQFAQFTLADGIYGSTFYVATGFHGLHVIIGTIFLAVCLMRHIFYHFIKEQHLGLEFAIWYWHFVDVVWLFLFVSIYWWGA